MWAVPRFFKDFRWVIKNQYVSEAAVKKELTA